MSTLGSKGPLLETCPQPPSIPQVGQDIFGAIMVMLRLHDKSRAGYSASQLSHAQFRKDYLTERLLVSPGMRRQTASYHNGPCRGLGQRQNNNVYTMSFCLQNANFSKDTWTLEIIVGVDREKLNTAT
jgi:hypothetical protein